MVPVKGRAPEISNDLKGLQARKSLHLKRLFKDRACPKTERSVQFNLLPLETAHHGKRTLGNNESCPVKGV
jgi:hypothetical protein